jgi:hypothetical protein
MTKSETNSNVKYAKKTNRGPIGIFGLPLWSQARGAEIEDEEENEDEDD